MLCDEDGREYTLRAQKKLRHQKMTPMVGDHVRFTPGQGEEDGWLEEILPRRSMMERPSVANVDMLMLVIASVPQPDMLLCDKLILRAEKGGMIPAICVNKIDLGDDLAEQIRREIRRHAAARVQRQRARRDGHSRTAGGHARQGHMSGRAVRRGQKLAAQRAV
ncbi:MAG: GTPase RsgA [Christensenellales bacterium]